MDLIERQAAIESIKDPVVKGFALYGPKNVPSIPAVPLDKLCVLLAEMYHCPSSGWPSSGHACHPSCPDEAFEKLCGTDCENYSDAERWKAFLTKWMEGLDAK